jgi:hypothetical protein
MITRNEGYRRAEGKEEKGLLVVEDFFREVLNAEAVRVTGQENYEVGDLRFAGGTVECKAQPINPEKYKNNFVEVFETPDTGKAHHKDGIAKLSTLLQMSQEEIMAVRVSDKRDGSVSSERQQFVGNPEFVSVSLSTLFRAKYMVYVNPYMNPENHIYVYKSNILLDLVRRAISRRGFVRGAGLSNDDTFAVYVPHEDHWRNNGAGWAYSGDGTSYTEVLRELHSLLAK